MGRQKEIAESIISAILATDHGKRNILGRILYFISAFLTLFRIRLVRLRNDIFHHLRNRVWQIDEDGYDRSFAGQEPLETKGDMGFSGSSFFNTTDGKYLVKSVPRGFEHSFFRDDLLQPYAEYVESSPTSLLIRITDFLGWANISLGGMLGIVPNYHIVMENLLVGRDEAAASSGTDTWQTWDLKPTSYFFPERDIANGKLTSAATKSKLADTFDDKIVLTQSERENFLSQLENDTALLAQHKAVDYSLFLVRIPLSEPQNPFAAAADADADADIDNAPPSPTYPPFAPPSPPTWRTGMRSADGKYVFRAAVLDFFWAKHKVQPRLFTALIKAYNLLDRKGPMSITTSPEEYRQRFLGMCGGFVEVDGEGDTTTLRNSGGEREQGGEGGHA
jgi:hypothetical protein